MIYVRWPPWIYEGLNCFNDVANTRMFLTASVAGVSVCREGLIASDLFSSWVCRVKPFWDNGVDFGWVRDPVWFGFDVWHEYISLFLILVLVFLVACFTLFDYSLNSYENNLWTDNTFYCWGQWQIPVTQVSPGSIIIITIFLFFIFKMTARIRPFGLYYIWPIWWQLYRVNKVLPPKIFFNLLNVI